MRHSVLKHNAFWLLDNIEGRVDVGEIADRLIKAEIIQDDPSDYRNYQLQQARDLIRQHRKSKQKNDDVQHELAHLFEIGEDGLRHSYYKPCGQLTAHESLQHLQYWKKRVKEDVAKLERYRDFHVEQHGRKLKRMLPRDLFDFAPA